jgi:hypothetical protein
MTTRFSYGDSTDRAQTLQPRRARRHAGAARATSYNTLLAAPLADPPVLKLVLVDFQIQFQDFPLQVFLNIGHCCVVDNRVPPGLEAAGLTIQPALVLTGAILCGPNGRCQPPAAIPFPLAGMSTDSPKLTNRPD